MAILGAQTNRVTNEVLDDATTARINRLCDAHGIGNACKLVGVSRMTFDAIRGQSHVRASTAKKVRETLDRIGAI